jgi:hypothetical protein
VDDLLRRLGEGLSPREADEELDAVLVEVAPPDLRARTDREIDEELSPFRSRMTPEVFDLTRRRARVDRLRRELDLPRLSLAQKTGPDVE